MAEKKKPKPGPSTGGSSTSRIKKPKGSQPLTLGTGGLRTTKVSKKQMAGTRKVVGAIAAVTPVGRAAKGASNLAGKAINKGTRKKYEAGVYQTDGIRPGIKDAIQARKVSKSFKKYWEKQDNLSSRRQDMPGVTNANFDRTLAPRARKKRTSEASKYDMLTRPKASSKKIAKYNKKIDKAFDKNQRRALKSINTKKYTKKK